ncbi:MAG: leucine-rich repeat protein, partial [Phycisphaeraceae bacterium]|nr:leucine-rich repeat protein [Phycisphaeraceae bacterium]
AGQISQCYSSGRVVGATDVGGLIGSSSGAVESSFWEVDTSVRVFSAGGVGRYSSQMAEAQTFLDAGWDFSGNPGQGVDPVWYMAGLQPRPVLLGTGHFSVNAQSSPGGGVIEPGQGVYDYVHGTVLTVQAQPDPHYHFVSWSGSIVEQGWLSDPNVAATSLQVLGHGHLLAIFAIDRHTVTIGHADHGKISEPKESSGVYAYGAQIPVSAVPDDRYLFSHWQTEGAVVVDHVTNPNALIHVLGDGAVYAQFVLQTKAYIPDPSLRAAIEAALGTQDVTMTGMKALTRLEVPDANVFDLTGLEHATHLTYLDLTGNDIIDINAISALTELTTLGLAQNRIVDCSPLAPLVQLDWVFLDDNRIIDVTAFAGLKKLTLVNLNNNRVNSIESFAQCPLLEVAWLNHNQISAISPLVDLERLGWLSLIGNPLDNVTGQQWTMLKQTVEQKNLGKILHSPFTFVQ